MDPHEKPSRRYVHFLLLGPQSIKKKNGLSGHPKDLGKHKPKPDVSGFNKFLSDQDLDADEVWYIGDKRSDLTMADDASVGFIGAGWLRDTLTEGDCDYFCADLGLLPILIGRLDSRKALKFSQQ